MDPEESFRAYVSGRIALRAGGGTEILVKSPGEVLAMDVSRDLLEAGLFGSPARDPEPFPARPVILVILVPASTLTVSVIGVPVLWWWRRRRRRWRFVRQPERGRS